MKVYCPRCGQEQISAEIRFCSRCGFLMSGLTEAIINGGLISQYEAGARPPSPRRKGLKQGGAWFLLGILIVPLIAVLSQLLFFPRQFIGLAAIIFFLGGFLRMIYALIFESGNPADKTLEENVMQTAQRLLHKKPKAGALPSDQSIPIDAYAPPKQSSWRDTSDLEPSSVTDSTTKLLNKTEK